MKVSTIKIISNGQPRGTHIYSGETDLSDYCEHVRFSHSAQSMPVAEIDMSFVAIEATDIPVHMLGPGGKRVRRIEYWDGSTDEFSEVSDD